jgi:hypothetical protein
MTILIQQQQLKAQSLKQRVCELLQWTDEEYAAFQYETGLAYLKGYIPYDSYGADQLSRSRTFWNWWKNQWQQRDEKFLNYCRVRNERLAFHNMTLIPEDAKTFYEEEHNPAILIGTTHPNAIVLNQTYAEMIQLIIDDVNEKV